MKLIILILLATSASAGFQERYTSQEAELACHALKANAAEEIDKAHLKELKEVPKDDVVESMLLTAFYEGAHWHMHLFNCRNIGHQLWVNKWLQK